MNRFADLGIPWEQAVIGAHAYKLYKYKEFDESWELKAAKFGYYKRKTFILPFGF